MVKPCTCMLGGLKPQLFVLSRCRMPGWTCNLQVVESTSELNSCHRGKALIQHVTRARSTREPPVLRYLRLGPCLEWVACESAKSLRLFVRWERGPVLGGWVLPRVSFRGASPAEASAARGKTGATRRVPAEASRA